MPEINAYALSLELSLKDMASEALRSMSNLANQVETKLKDIQIQLNNLEVGSIKAGKNIANAIKGIAIQDTARIDATKKGLDAVQQQEDVTKRLQNFMKKYQDRYNKIEKKTQDRTTKFNKTRARNDLVRIIKSKEMVKLFKMEGKNEAEMTKIASELLGAFDNINDSSRRQKKINKENNGQLGEWYEKLGTIGNIIGNIQSGATNIFGKLGISQLSQAVTVTGLLDIGVAKAAARAEKFHTINYRGMGTMEEMNKEIIKMGTQGLPVTTEELTDATIALREMGGQQKTVLDLRTQVAALGRISGMSSEDIARYSVRMVGLGGSIEQTKNDMAMMVRVQKQIGLSGKNMNAVMRNITDQTWLLGTSGTVGMGQYQKAMFRLSDSANKMGADVEGVTKNVGDALIFHAIQIDAITGKNTDNVEDRFKNLAETVSNLMKELPKKGTQEFQASWQAMSKIMRTMGIEPSLQMAEVLANAHEKGIDVQEAMKGIGKTADQELKGAAKDAEDLVRKQQIFVDRVESSIQEMFTEIRKGFTNLFDSLNLKPATAQWTAYGSAGVAAFDSIINGGMNMISFGVNIITAWKTWKIAAILSGKAGVTAMAGVAEAGKTAASAVSGNTGVFGKLIQIAKGGIPIIGKFGATLGRVAMAVVRLAAGPWGVIIASLAIIGKAVYEGIKTWQNNTKAIDEQKSSLEALNKAHKNSGPPLNDYDRQVEQLFKRRNELLAVEEKKKGWWDKLWGDASLETKETKKLYKEITELRVKQNEMQKTKVESAKDAAKAEVQAQQTASKQIIEGKQTELQAQEAMQEKYAIRVDAIIGKEAKNTEERQRNMTEFASKQAMAELQAQKAIQEEKKQQEIIPEKRQDIKDLYSETAKLIQKTDQESKAREGKYATEYPTGAEIETRVQQQLKEAQDRIQAQVTKSPVIPQVDVVTATQATKEFASAQLKQLDKLRGGTAEYEQQWEVISHKMKSLGVESTRQNLQLLAKANTAAPEQPKKVEPLVTSKIVEGTMRDEHISILKEHSNDMNKMIDIIDSIKGKIGTGDSVDLIAKLIKQYLPEMVETRHSGLSIAANQWQPT